MACGVLCHAAVGNERTLLFAALLASAGCGQQPERAGEVASAIEGGRADLRDSGVVGLGLLGEAGDLQHTCTGTLVTPNLVLTARHCVAEASRFVDCQRSVFGATAAPERVIFTTLASIWSTDSGWLSTSRVITSSGERVCGNDIALVELSSPVGADHASPIAPRLDTRPVPHELYTAIGYGAQDAAEDGVGLRRRRDGLRVTCVGSGCGSDHVEVSEWRGDTGACDGDSGGPALDTDGLVIGVTSRGPEGCASPIYSGLPAHADWLRDEVRQAAQTGAYELPPWVDGAPEVVHDAPREDPPVVRAGTCSAGPPAVSRAGVWLLVAVAVAAGRRRRG